jgi:hypothetical protein
MPIDIVYPLGSGSIWQNNELRFSLRALEKNLKGYRNIYVVGVKPPWIKNVIHIPFPDQLVNNADGNITRKVLRVCQEADLSDDFLFINDDHFILKPIEASQIPPYHKGDLNNFPKGYFEQSFWRGRLWRTKNVLQEKGYPTLHFDAHVPIIFNKHRYPEVMSRFDFEKNIGFTMKSLYGNVVYGTGAPRLQGEKVTVFKIMPYEGVKRICKNRQFAAVNNAGLKTGFKRWLYEELPLASIFETDVDTREGFFEVATWIESNHNYEQGIRIFEKYGKSRKVKKFLTRDASTARRMKLEHSMKELLNYL